MEETIERILSHPLLLVALSLICLLLLFAVLKRLVKMACFAVILVALYFGYIHFFEDRFPLPEVDMEQVDQMKEGFIDWVAEDLNSSFFEENRSNPH